MNPPRFRYHVSLRITHPDIEPEAMTAALGLTPKKVEHKGEAARRLFERLPAEMAARVRNKHRWFHLFEPASPDEPLTACMRTAIARLREQRAFLAQVHATGGRVQFGVYLYPPGGRDEPFDYHLITELRELGVGFQITMYPRMDYLADPTDFADAPPA